MKIKKVETKLGVKKADVQKWVKLYTIGGWSISQISKACGRCWATIYKYLRLEGVKIRTRRVISDKELGQWIRLYEVKKWSTIQISKRFNVPVSTVMYQLKKVGITLRSRKEAQALRKGKRNN